MLLGHAGAAARRESARARGRRDRPRRRARDRPAAGPRHDRRRGRRRAARPAPAAAGRRAVPRAHRARPRGAGRSAPLHRARDGRGRHPPVAGRRGSRSGRRSTTASTTTSSSPSRSRPTTSAGSRRRCGGSSPPSTRSCAPTASTRRELAEQFRGEDQPYKLELVEALRRRRHQRLRPGRVRGPVPRPAPADHQADQGVQAALAGRRVLARRLVEADADPHLRHRVLRPGSRWTPTWSGSSRRGGATTGGSAASSTSTTPARCRRAAPFWHPRGMVDLERADRAVARAEPRARLPGGAHADPLLGRPVEAVRPLGQVPRRHVLHRRRTTGCSG